jgi:hypothetical protein
VYRFLLRSCLCRQVWVKAWVCVTTITALKVLIWVRTRPWDYSLNQIFISNGLKPQQLCHLNLWNLTWEVLHDLCVRVCQPLVLILTVTLNVWVFFFIGFQILDRLADIMTFGSLERCEVCKTGQFVYRSGVGYQCLGDLTEWTRCQNTTLEPKRKPFKVPPELSSDHAFL